MAKAIQITSDVYDDLVHGKEIAVEVAKKQANNELAKALMAMGIGAFAGWLIYKALADLEQDAGK